MDDTQSPPSGSPDPPSDDRLHELVVQAARAGRLVIDDRVPERLERDLGADKPEPDAIFEMTRALQRSELFANEPDDKGRPYRTAKYEVPRRRWNGRHGLYIKIVLRLPHMRGGKILSFWKRTSL